MPDLTPARWLRPAPGSAGDVLAPPYDVVSTSEAAALAAGRPHSLLHVTRAEIDLPGGAADGAVHAQARRALDALVADGVLVQDDEPRLLVYRLVRDGRSQTGIVGCASVADYEAGTVAVHERTRADKEADRVAHLEALGVHDEPVFLMHRAGSTAAQAISNAVGATTSGPPDVDVTAPDGVRHVLWTLPVVHEDDVVGAFAAMDRIYVADGHHRSAAAAVLAERRRDQVAAQRFPVVVFATDELTVLPYHRVVATLGVHDEASFLAAVAEHYDVAASPTPVEATPGTIGIRLRGGWFRAVPRTPATGSVAERLDVAVLTRLVLDPVLGVTDLRTDPRIAFVGGSRGTAELDRLVDSGEAAVAFSMPATSPDDVLAVADAGEIMPPKSTWFEPKLGSGLFLHPFA